MYSFSWSHPRLSAVCISLLVMIVSNIVEFALSFSDTHTHPHTHTSHPAVLCSQVSISLLVVMIVSYCWICSIIFSNTRTHARATHAHTHFSCCHPSLLVVSISLLVDNDRFLLLNLLYHLAIQTPTHAHTHTLLFFFNIFIYTHANLNGSHAHTSLFSLLLSSYLKTAKIIRDAACSNKMI